MASGTYQIDLLLANVCKQNVTRFPYEIARLAEDIAGGVMVTMPSEKDLQNPQTAKYVKKYLRGVASVPTETRMRVLRLIENITLGSSAVGYRTESMHGAGSPQAQRIMIARQGNLAKKKALARVIACIPDPERTTPPPATNGSAKNGTAANGSAKNGSAKADAQKATVAK
jgi:4-hydroxybutyryl-CoA dehydratase/vinylacetyl-CoA-Delta-isomerase